MHEASKSRSGEPNAVVAEQLDVALGGRSVLKRVSLSVRHGEITALVGPNGAGKSTLLKTVAGLIPYGGSLTVDGTAVSAYDQASLARTLAFVPQRSGLSAALRVETVVAQGRFSHEGGLPWPGRDRQKACHEVSQAMAQTDVLALRGRRFTELSMGERRRVLLARGLATGARILLFDEPSSALDVRHVLELEALLQALRADGYAIVVVLHDLGEVRRVADEAVLLVDGAVTASGPVQDVIASGPVRNAYGVELEENTNLGYRLPT